MAPYEGEDAVVLRVEEGEAATAEGPVALAKRDQPPGPPEERVRIPLLVLDVHRLVVIAAVDHHRQVELLRVGAREAGVSVAAPLHGRADAVSVPQVDVVPHPDLVAVVEDRRPGQGEEEAVHQLDPPPVVAEEGGEPPPDPQVDPRLGVLGVDPVHVVAVLVGHHLQGQLVVVAQEGRPLAALGDLGRLLEDVDDGEAVLHADRHEEPRHDREVEGHVALVAVAEVGDRVLRPLVGLGEEHPAGELRVDMGAELL